MPAVPGLHGDVLRLAELPAAGLRAPGAREGGPAAHTHRRTRLLHAAALRPAPAAPAAAPPEAPRRWREELWFHLLPWSRNFGREIFAIRAVAAFLVVTVTTAWLLAAAHQIGAVIILAWWLGWSVYEIETRMHYKPLVKEGPWWRHDFRKATLADMIFYVGTKNLLIAAALFLIINVPAVAVFLRHLSSQWPLA